MTIAEILALPDDAVIDVVEARGKFFPQDGATGSAGYTAQNGTIRDDSGEVRIRVTNAAAMPDNVPLELTIRAGENTRDGTPCGVIRRTFRDTPQVYTTGKATIVWALADEAAVTPPEAPDDRPVPESDDGQDLPPAAPAPVAPRSATVSASAPRSDGCDFERELEEHFRTAVKMAQRICVDAGIEFRPELATSIVIDAGRKNRLLRDYKP